MKRSVFILVFTIFAAFAAPAQVNVGMTDTASYYPLLRGRRVAVLANQTSVAELPGAPGADASGRVHLVDLLHGEGFAVAAIFSPEHGFRGTADAGEQVASSVDARTGIPIRSLYDGNAKRPSDEAMRSFDVLVVGGGPAGIGAAIAAARGGMRVTLLEKRGFLGGNVTDSNVGIANHYMRRIPFVSSGLYAEMERGFHAAYGRAQEPRAGRCDGRGAGSTHPRVMLSRESTASVGVGSNMLCFAFGVAPAKRALASTRFSCDSPSKTKWVSPWSA